MVHNFRVPTELPYQGELEQSFRNQFIPFPSAVAQSNQQLPYPRQITHNNFLGFPNNFWLTTGHYTIPVQSYIMSSSSMLDDGPPEKKFRIDISDKEVKVDVESSLSPDTTITSMTTGSLERQPLTGESVDGQSPAGPSSARSSNASVVSTGSAEKDDDSDIGMTGNLLEMISKSLLGNVFKVDDCTANRQSLSPLTNASGSNPASTIPGALAVSQTPAAQLFAEDDWSWHRNPAASIRSGGTNKQTPVWKYFVYNKAENISRCIIGDCTYILKGPHTSTLACHLKKHPDEYAEFQKLKVDYTRERHGGNQPGSPTAQQMVPPTQNMMHKVPKKKERDMNNFVSAIRSQQSQSVQPGSPLPNIMQNLLAMNPLQFMLNPQMNTPTSSAPANNNNAHATASHMLHQAGLTMSTNGQIVQSKKWRRDERRQRELESRMSLAMAVSHTETDAVSLQMWKEVLEVAQPKFYFPEEHSVFEQMVCSHLNRMQQTIKSQLAQSRRIALSVETVRIPPVNGIFDETINRITVTATFPGYSTPRYELQSVLLASRPLLHADTASEAVKNTVEQILSEYDVSMDKVSRVVWSGLKDVEADEIVFEKTIEPFAERLISCFNTFVDQSSQVDELRKSVINLIFGFISKPETLTALNKATGGTVELPLTESFPILAEAVIKIRDVIQMLYEQGLLIGNLNDQQWRLLHGFCTVSQLFKQCIWGDVHSIDAAIPSVKQLLLSLEKDQHAQLFYNELHELISDKMRSITDVNDENFDGSYIQATALNPQLAVLLDDCQLQYAKKSLENILKKRLPLIRSSSANGVDALLASVLQQQQKMASQEGVNPIYADILQQAHDRINQDRSPSKEKMAETIINSYFDEILSGCSVEALLSPFAARSFGNPFQPPLQFWLQAANHSAQLSELASELLSVPASCPTLARLLSRRSRESPWSNKDYSIVFANLERPEKLERDIMLRYNRNLLPKTY